VTTKLIIDTDCGVDDAIAILMALADPAIEVIGITCVEGNVPLDLVMRNVAIVLDAAGAKTIPIFRGAARPLVGMSVHAHGVHGNDGLGDAGFPLSTRLVDPESGILALVHMVTENPGCGLVALGPLTNLALALAIEPNLPDLLSATVIMGGAVQGTGNTTPVAEFNIYADPEAAAMVFGRGLNPTILTWEATLASPVLWAEWERLLNCGTVGRHFIKAITASNSSRAHERARLGILMPDPLAMGVFLDPSCATTYSAMLEVDTSHGIARGLTALDRYGITGRPSNTQIVSAVDQSKFGALLERACKMECKLAA